MFGVFVALAECERELISERIRVGLAPARARGRVGGCSCTMTPRMLRLAMASRGKPVTNIGALCKELRISRQMLYRHVACTGERDLTDTGVASTLLGRRDASGNIVRQTMMPTGVSSAHSTQAIRDSGASS